MPRPAVVAGDQHRNAVETAVLDSAQRGSTGGAPGLTVVARAAQITDLAVGGVRAPPGGRDVKSHSGFGIKKSDFRGKGLRLSGLGFENSRNRGLGLSVVGCRVLGFRVHGSGLRVWSLWFRVQGLSCRVWGLEFRVQGLWLRV